MAGNDSIGMTPKRWRRRDHPGPGGRTVRTNRSKTASDSGGVLSITVNQTTAERPVITAMRTP